MVGSALALLAVALASRFQGSASAVVERRALQRTALLQLQRTSKGKPPVFGGPSENPAELNLKGFCKRSDCTEPPCEPVCQEQPCCCWSTFGAPKHALYASPDEVKATQECLYPPEGFVYSPEPGNAYDDGYMTALDKANLPTYDGRRLCCLRRDAGVQDESQRDLRFGVKTSSTTTATTTTTAGVPEPGEVDAAFTTELVTTSLMNPGDEYENAQMEEAARAHLAAANDLQSAVGALNSSATAIEEIDAKMQTDPNLVRSRKHVAEMRAAIRAWAERRWANLNRLKSGDVTAFDNAPGPPQGLQ